MMKKASFFCVLEGLGDCHRTVQLQLLQHLYLGPPRKVPEFFLVMYWLGPQVLRAKLLSVMSDSLQTYGLKPTRLPCPWASPGKSTGVGCHALLQGNLPDLGIEPGCPALLVTSLSQSHWGGPINQQYSKKKKKLALTYILL